MSRLGALTTLREMCNICATLQKRVILDNRVWVTLDYPVKRAKRLELRADDGKSCTRAELARKIALAYRDMYADEAATTTLRVESLRERTGGKYTLRNSAVTDGTGCGTIHAHQICWRCGRRAVVRLRGQVLDAGNCLYAFCVRGQRREPHDLRVGRCHTGIGVVVGYDDEKGATQLHPRRMVHPTTVNKKVASPACWQPCGAIPQSAAGA